MASIPPIHLKIQGAQLALASIPEIPVLDHGLVRCVDFMGTDQLILQAARISYKSEGKGDDGDKKLLRYLLVNKHTSPFEMGKIVFDVKLPIFVMRQWVRHRMQNLNEVSARYTELPNEFYVPDQWRAQDGKNKQGSVIQQEWILPPDNSHDSQNFLFSRACKHAYDTAYKTYENLLAQGVAREMARIVLPLGIYTEIFSCWDLNNLLKFFALRDNVHAQSEIQQYAKAMKVIAKQLFPWTMELYEDIRKNQTLATQPQGTQKP